MNFTISIPAVEWPVLLAVLAGIAVGYIWGALRWEDKARKEEIEVQRSALRWANTIVAELDNGGLLNDRQTARLSHARKVLAGEERTVWL